MSSWPSVELGTIADVAMGQSPPGNTYNDDSDGLPFFQGKTDFGHRFPIVRKWCSQPKRIAEAGDILLSVRAPVGPTNVARELSCIGRGLAAIRASADRVEQEYLRLFFKYQEGALALRGQGSTFGAINRRDIERLEVPLPPPAEQRRIVQILDQADQLRRRRVEADAKADRILPALFVKMFGDPTTNPMSWPVKRFDSICESRLGKMLDAKRKTGLYLRPYLRNANVYWDRLVLDDLLEMDFDDVDQREFRLQPGDILICEGGEVGRSAIWNDELSECYFQKALHRARPFPEVAVSEFVVYLLWELSRRRALQRSASRVTFAHLTGVKLKALRVPVPPIGLQQVFARRVRMLKKSVNGNNTAARLDSIFSILLYRAFSGGLSESNCGTCTTGPST